MTHFLLEVVMDLEELTADVVAAATSAFASLISAKPDEHFYAFALYTDSDAYTIMPSANSIERHEAKMRDIDETDERNVAPYKWATAEWAYEAWRADLFQGVYDGLRRYRDTLTDSEADFLSYKKLVHECMISALERMDRDGFFANGREGITLFVSISDDDEDIDLENFSAKRLNPERIYLPFLQRYGDSDAGAP